MIRAMAVYCVKTRALSPPARTESAWGDPARHARGRAYAENGHVRSLALTEHSVTARVTGTTNYHVTLHCGPLARSHVRARDSRTTASYRPVCSRV